MLYFFILQQAECQTVAAIASAFDRYVLQETRLNTSIKTAVWSASLHFTGWEDHALPVTATKSGSRCSSSLRSAQGHAALKQESCMQHKGSHDTPDKRSIGRADWACRALVSDKAEANQQPQLTAQEAMPVQVPSDMSLAIS